MNPAVSARGISKSYGAHRVLNGLRLEVPSGGIYGLYGSNGCGKSTLLRVLAGSIRPDSGDIHVSGLTGYVAQKFSLYPDLTVEENLAFFGRCYRPPDAALQETTEAVMRRAGLTPLRRSRACHLSHGWKQRLSLAAALCHEPSVLLLDEPTAGLDPAGRADFWDVVSGYSRRGMAVVLTTHFSDEAARCSATGRLEDGVIVPLELRS